MKTYKLKTTRPEFLLEIMSSGDVYGLTIDGMSQVMRDGNDISYCVYSILMESDIDRNDIISMNYDGESIAITFKNKNIAKQVKELCNNEIVRYGNKLYKIFLKLHDKHLIATCTLMGEDEE